jgi:hypothetical protein
MIQMKHVGISRIFYFTILHSSKCNSVSVKQNINFNFQPPSTLVFLVLLKIVHHLKIYQHTEFYVSTSTGFSFAANTEVWMPAVRT